MIGSGEHILFLFIRESKIIYFSRNPVGSDAEAIYIKEDDWFLAEAYQLALFASGFSQYKGAFSPCPLGTFTNLSTKGLDGCLKCPPGNF